MFFTVKKRLKDGRDVDRPQNQPGRSLEIYGSELSSLIALSRIVD